MNTRTMAQIAVFAAALCILCPLSVPIPVSPVPLTLASLAIAVTAVVLRSKRAVAAVLVYLLLGACGLPVFSGFAGGAAKLVGPTGGYLLGYLAYAAVIGSANVSSRLSVLLRMIAATAVLYAFGTAWLTFSLHITLKEGFLMGVIPYIPLDSLKVALVVITAPVLSARLAFKN